MLRRRTGPPRSTLGTAPRTSHRLALLATTTITVAWLLVTVYADSVAPWVAAQATAGERWLGLDVAIPEEEE